MNDVQKGPLLIILNDYESPYSLLPEKAHQRIFHQGRINSLLLKVCKYQNGHSTDIMNDIFK